MRFFSSLLAFILTIILSNTAFTYVTVNFTTTMRDLLRSVQRIREQAAYLSLSDSVMVWIDIFFEPKLIVFVGFSILICFLLAIFVLAFWKEPQRPVLADAVASAAIKRPFGRWG